MKATLILAGLGAYCLLLKFFFVPMLILFGLITGGFLLLVLYGLLDSSVPTQARREYQPHDIDARD
ncbi:hypothetical protein [Cupriavidus gilardii]|uniref:hypothetical protein n=1 Tax=Cupriavidus gilardii TaxID=82541 RepID=UPI0021B3DE4B|nr:hypothetical protein [Cupriavidus gilardii]UXC36640.1 hypothetical protein N4G38_04020 [Cupriavidus gilardii]